MGRYTAGARTGAGSTTLPILSLYGGAAIGGVIREVSVTNVTAVACELKLARLTSQGTPGAGLAEAPHSPYAGAAGCTAFTTHTVAPGLGVDLGARAAIGAAIGAGYVWTFGDEGLIIPVGTANGIGIIVDTGTGQSMQAFVIWEE
jgi:hypothetical protein